MDVQNAAPIAPVLAPHLPLPALAGHEALLGEFAQKYIWWLTPTEALEYPARIVAQVMDLGEFNDARRLIEALGENTLRAVVARAEAGQFSERSWHYWHYRLGLARPDAVPPLPVRRVE